MNYLVNSTTPKIKQERVKTLGSLICPVAIVSIPATKAAISEEDIAKTKNKYFLLIFIFIMQFLSQ